MLSCCRSPRSSVDPGPGVYRLDEEAHPFLDLDDAGVLLDAKPPTDRRGHPELATDTADRPCGARRRRVGRALLVVMHRPQWTLHVLWSHADLTVEGVEPLAGHPGLLDAGRLLAKRLQADVL